MSTISDPQILVFKTNIRFKKDLRQLIPVLATDERIIEWNVDRSDVDRVLRIESNEMEPSEVVELVKKTGFHCQELSA